MSCRFFITISFTVVPATSHNSAHCFERRYRARPGQVLSSTRPGHHAIRQWTRSACRDQGRQREGCKNSRPPVARGGAALIEQPVEDVGNRRAAARTRHPPSADDASGDDDGRPAVLGRELILLRFLIRDRDQNSPESFDRVFQSECRARWAQDATTPSQEAAGYDTSGAPATGRPWGREKTSKPCVWWVRK